LFHNDLFLYEQLYKQEARNESADMSAIGNPARFLAAKHPIPLIS
jgi:hypothetical protein